jgi:2-polyprenyl-6-methoxyphenol hydroxylase-like FAD-dependent oxidoreductase
MKIGIVGGSLAGCTAASLLINAGHEITVFERSANDLTGRGGGIGTSKEVVEQITKEGLINVSFTCLTAKEMPFIGKNEAYEPFGRTAWSLPVEIKVFHWNELWQQLRQNVPDSYYHAGVEIIDAYQLESGMVEIITKQDEKHQFDLLLFADGYKSLGRKILFPDKQLKYRGYVLWRGLLDESEMRPGELEDNLPRMSYLDSAGHNVVYFIPNTDGSKEKGERIFNWAAYIAIPEAELNDLMKDKSGRVRSGTLPPGELSVDNELKLKKFLSKNIPEYYAEIVDKTANSYIQVIYTLDLDAYYKDNMCLIGDAGVVVQPFTGSGVFKGHSNIKDLITSMATHNNLEDALKEWSLQQVETGKKLLAYGEQLEKAFIWEPMNFSEAEEKDVARWFKQAVTAPGEFNFERKT